MYKFFLPVILQVGLVSWALSQPPEGYYQPAAQKTGFELKTALHQVVDNHAVKSYGNLWELFYTSDARSDGFVWCMYSACDFVFGEDQDTGGTGSGECNFYNREHIMPRSWFGGSVNPMNTDAHHISPVDRSINSSRGNHPYGEVLAGTETNTYSNGGKRGTNKFEGFDGVVFEPIDEFKGDLARIYLYMAIRYEDVIPGWPGSPQLNGTQDQVFADWSLAMLLNWHEMDPVSQKELARQEAVYAYQGNRNPLVDHPEAVACIWNNECEAWLALYAVEEEEDVVASINPDPDYVIEIFPNPAQSQILVKTNLTGPFTYFIVNSKGLAISQGALNESSKFTLEGIVPGVYFIVLESIETYTVRKIIVQ